MRSAFGKAFQRTVAQLDWAATMIRPMQLEIKFNWASCTFSVKIRKLQGKLPWSPPMQQTRDPANTKSSRAKGDADRKRSVRWNKLQNPDFCLLLFLGQNATSEWKDHQSAI